MSAAIAKHRSTDHRPINRGDLESKLRELQGGVEEGKATAASYALTVGVVVVVAVGVGAFLMGRRRGKKRTTVVEVRRI